MKKFEIRKINKALRNDMSKDDVFLMSKNACNIFLNSDLYKSSHSIMVYSPLGNETKTDLILDCILSDNKTAVLPFTNTETNEIIPVKFNENTKLIKGAFNILEPEKKNTIKKNDIDLCIVPGIAFDLSGQRVGFGKGYYDRFLKDTNIIKIGFCYEFQVVNHIVSDEFDIKMDYIITESKIIDCRN